MDRKAELEKKKQKLAALRADKEARRREKEAKDVDDATGRVVSGASIGGGTDRDSRRDLDEMLSSLGVAPVSEVLSSLSSVTSAASSEHSSHTTTAVSVGTGPGSIGVGTNGGVDGVGQLHGGSPHGAIHNRKQTPVMLSVTSVAATNIPPKETVVYTKQTQTSGAAGAERDAHATDYYDEYNLNPGLEWEDEFTGDDEENSLPHIDHGFHSKLPPGILPHGLPTVKEVAPAITPQEKSAHKEADERKEVIELSEEQKQMIVLSEEFQKFVVKTGRIIERALTESVDIYTDYIGGGDNDDATDERSGARLSLNRTFYCDRWSKNRCVTSMDWSTHFPELLLASYHNNEESPNEPDGVCMVWNTKFKKTTPEDVFHCQSAVMSACFAKFHPNLILGGTYSGQIVLWDNRVQKRTPIQRSPLNATAHTHPVYCLAMVGTQNAHNVISVSSDGKLCSWSLDMLAQPQDILELNYKQAKSIAVTSMAFPHNEINTFVLGGENGYVYSGCRHGTRSGITDVYEKHLGPVTGVSTHYNQSSPNFGHLYLTSSMDWTIKLWSLKEQRPLYSFEDNSDYVTDVAWSPIHPALFAGVDGSGRLDLWNLNQDTEVPVASVVVDGQPALNRVSWTPSGLHVTIGDDAGRIYVYDVAEHLANPRVDEWTRFAATLNELKMNQADEFEASAAAGVGGAAAAGAEAGKAKVGGGGGGGGGAGPSSVGVGGSGPMSLGAGVGGGGQPSSLTSLSSSPSLA